MAKKFTKEQVEQDLAKLKALEKEHNEKPDNNKKKKAFDDGLTATKNKYQGAETSGSGDPVGGMLDFLEGAAKRQKKREEAAKKQTDQSAAEADKSSNKQDKGFWGNLVEAWTNIKQGKFGAAAGNIYNALYGNTKRTLLTMIVCSLLLPIAPFVAPLLGVMFAVGVGILGYRGVAATGRALGFTGGNTRSQDKGAVEYDPTTKPSVEKTQELAQTNKNENANKKQTAQNQGLSEVTSPLHHHREQRGSTVQSTVHAQITSSNSLEGSDNPLHANQNKNTSSSNKP